MAQVIKIKRGGIESLVASTPTLQQGELLLATGSVNGLGATFFVASASNSPSLPYAKVESISDGPALASSLDGNFEGLLIHSSSDNKLYRYNGTAFVELPIAAGSFVGTLPVSNGGTNATSFADKAVIISQDSGTDTLSALALTTSGQLVIGGASGPTAATLTEGTGLTITNGDGSITIATNDGEIDHDSLLNFSADEHFTQANITTVGTVTSGDVSAILPSGTVSGSSQTVANLDGQDVTVSSLTVENSFTGFQLKNGSGTATYVKFSPTTGLEIDLGGYGNSISASQDIKTHGDFIGANTHIRLTAPDGGGSGLYLSSSGELSTGNFKLSLGDIEGEGNSTTLIVDDINEQISLSKTLSVTGNITVTGTVDGVDIASLENSVQANDTEIANLTAATSSYSTATGVENNADVTDFTNVQAAGALMDSEVTSLSLIKGLTAAQISGAFDSVSASLASNIPTNNNQLTNGAGYITDYTVTSGDVTAHVGDIDHDSLLNFSADEHFTQANITTVGTVTSGDVSAILPTGTVSGSEQVEDIVGGMLTGNTETLITVTYQDGDGTIDFVVDNDLSNYSNASTNFITTGASVGGDLTGTIASATVTKIQNTSITSTQAGYLATLDQSVSSSASPTFAGLTVTGDVSVQGSLTTVNSNEVNLGDRIITLNTADGAGDAGIQVHDTNTAETGSLLWDTDGNYWKVGVVGGTDYRLAEWDGETAGGGDFIHTDSNGRINAINTTTDGDLLISDGDGTFTVTNVIDGGTY